MISFAKAATLANTWMRAQTDLPIYTYPLVRPHDPELNGRPVEVVVAVRFSTDEVKTYRLAQLLATDEELLAIHTDRRRYVEELLETAKYEFIKGSSYMSRDNFDAYYTFCDALDCRRDAPDWFETIELQSESAQKSGYDCWVYITTLSKKSVRIPVKVFCSKRERAEHNRRKTPIHLQQMVTLVVTGSQDPEDTRGRLYHLLRQMRNQRIYK